MKKVVFLNRYFYPDHSATSQMLSDLAFFLASRGIETHVICSRQRYDDANARLPAKELCFGVRVHRVWTTRFGRYQLLGRAIDYLSFYLSSASALFFCISKDAVVIAKTDPPLISVFAAIIVNMRSARLVNWIQDLFPEVAMAIGLKVMNPFISGILKKVRNKSLYTAKKNIVIGELMSQRILEEGVESKKITVIPNWGDGEQIRPIARQDNYLRDSWGFKGKFVVGYSGNLGLAHDFSTIFDAARMLEKDSRIVFLIIGGGAKHYDLERKAASFGLKNICFKPYQPRSQLSNSLCVPDVHLISLRPELEGLIVPSKIYGILAAGRPSIFIGDKDGEIANMQTKWNCGLSVSENDAQGLVNAIIDLLYNENKYQAMSKKSRESFCKEYDMHISTDKWIKLLEQIN